MYILEIKESRRRAGSVDVQTQIRAKDAAGVQVLANTLGSGDALKTKLNKNYYIYITYALYHVHKERVCARE